MFKVFQTKGKSCDWGILVSVVFLCAMGVLMVYSASSVYALKKFGNESYFLKRHAIYLTLGFASMIILMNLNYQVLKKLAYPAYALGLIMLALVLLPGVSSEMGGARRWVDLDFFSFQPAEVAKFLLIFYLAYSLTRKKDSIAAF